ncbi:uncharacterized protein LOC124383762 isoform X2 [Silurus meridionalis]|uniref:uncharacterized protein LOC124383762 isoform X2 n=1 Tax=Silurus meridionalis TaxID=175797 RepID=UPI001EEB73F5|nr:uncharacterized protein LOC124383762 isoform X2 [Silurus meridionalis]
MSGRNPKKLASSRRYKNRNRDTEEKENDGSEQSHLVPESQASNESSVLHSDQPVIACTNPNTSDIEQSLHPQSQDPLARAEVTSKKRKMGSTRKPRNIKFEGIHEDEPEHMIQISEGVRDEQGWTPESSIKEDRGKDDQKCILDCAGNNESSILQEQHLAIMLSEEEHQNSEKVIQNKPMDNSFTELNQSLKTEFGQDLLHTSLDFSIVTPANCNVPLQESDESLQICHQMDTFSEPVVSLPNTTDQTSMINISYTPLNENREESLDVQASLEDLLQNDEPSMTEHTVLKTMEDQSSLDFIIIEKQEDKQEREDVDIPNNCSAEDIGQNEVPELQSASVIKEHEHGTQDDKASKEDENVVDLEHMDDTLKLITESIGKFKSTEPREDMDENKEYGETETSSQTCNLPHNNPGEFPSELELQSKKVCFDEMLENVIKDRSEFLALETDVVFEDNNDDINEDKNSGSTVTFTKEGFIRVDDEKDGVSTFMIENELKSVITNTQDYASADKASMVLEEFDIKSPDKESTSPVHIPPASNPMELNPKTQFKLDMQVYNPIAVPNQTQNVSEECIVNLTNRESEAEQFKSTFPIVHETRLGQDDAVAENVSFCHSEKNNIDLSHRNLGLLIPEGDQKETMQVQSIEEITCVSENVTFGFNPETSYHPRSTVSLNIKEPDQINKNVMEKDENVTNAVVENENTNSSQEHYEAPKHISTGLVSTNQECGVLDRQDEETVMVKNICGGVYTTHIMLSDDNEHLVDREDFKMLSRTERAESIVQNQEAICDGDKDGQCMSIEEPHQHTHIDLKFEESKSSESTEHVNSKTSALDTGEAAQLPEANNIQTTTTTTILEEDHVLISTKRGRKKMGSTRKGAKRELKDEEKVSNARGLSDIIEKQQKPIVNEEKDAESMLLNEQEITSVITPIHDNTFKDNACLVVKKHCEKSPDKHASSTCGAVELISETQAVTDMEIHTENVHEVEFDQNQNKCKEHLQNVNEGGKETEQCENTNQFVQIQESKSLQVDVIKEHLEFSNFSNKFEAIEKKENTQEEITMVIEEERNDPKDEINAGHTENFTKEDTIAVCSQQYTLCELSSQTTDLSLSTIKHPSPAPEHHEVMEENGNSVDNVDTRNAEIHTQTQIKKKKKFGSTRRPHGGHEQHAEEEKRELKDAEDTEEIEHQIITQDRTSHMITESQNPVSEVLLDISDSQVTTEQKEIIPSEFEIMTERINAPPALLDEVDQIHTELSDEVSNAGELTDVTEQDEKPVVNEEKDTESIVLNDQEMAPVISPIKNDAFMENVFLAVNKHNEESPDYEHASSTCKPVELIPEMQAMSDMQLTTEDINAVVSDENQNNCEEQFENPTSRESEPDQNVITNPLVNIQESKSPEVGAIEEHLEFSSSEKKRKIGSTRKSLRVQNPVSDQKNKYKTIEEKENIGEQNTDQNSSIDGVIKEEIKDSNEEIIAGQTENFTTEDITTVCSQQYTLCELSSQTTDLSLFTIEHPSPAPEHHGVIKDNGNSVDNVDTRNEEIHTQTQIKKKKKFGSTRRPHGEHKTHAEEEKGEWKNAEVTEEIKPQIITQDATSHMITESQNVSEMSLDINDLLVTTEQKEIIQSEIEIMTERINAPPALLNEVDQIHTELSAEVNNAGELTDVTEQDEKPVVNEEKDTESIVLNDQEMAPVISPIKNDAFMENVFLAVNKHNEESPDHEHASSTGEPVELIPEMQAMSDMQLTTEDIDAVVSDENQNNCEEQFENPASRESEPDQNVITNPLVKIQESKSPEVNVIEEHLEFSSSEKKRKIGSTRKSLRVQNPVSDQKNKYKTIEEKENIMEQNTDQNSSNDGVIKEEIKDSNEEIIAGQTENFTTEDITTVCSQQYTLCELSSQTTDMSLFTIEHPSPAPEHHGVMEDNGNSVDNVDTRNAEIHTQTQIKKKKKFGSTRRPHGEHKTHAEEEKGEWKDAEVTEEIKPQIITQDATSHMITESQNVSEMSLDINDSLVTTEQKEIIQSEIEIMTERINAPPALLNEVDQIHTELSAEVKNAGELADVTEQDEKTVVNEEKDTESLVLNDQEMAPVISPIKNDEFMENVFLAANKHNEESPDHEHASSTCEPVELIPEMQAMSDMQLTTEDIDAVLSDQNQNKCEEQFENPTSKESEPDQNVITSPLVKIQESKSPEVDVIEKHLEFSSTEKKRKIGSTRKSLRVQNLGSDQKNKYKTIEEKENIGEQNTNQNSSNDGVIKEEIKDSNEEIIAGQTENFTTEDITTVCSQQYTLCELSSQTTDLSLFTTEHPSPAPEHHEVMKDNGNSVDNVDTRNAEIHTQTQIKKKKKFGSTRRPHGEHKTHAEEEKGEWKDAEIKEEIEHQIITQDATSNILTESQNVSELSIDINDSLVTTEQKEIIPSEIEIMTEKIDAPPALLNEVDQIHIERSDEVNNAGELTDVTEQDEKTVVNEEKDTESLVLNDHHHLIISSSHQMAPVISPIKNDAFMENVFLAVNKHNEESPDHEHASSTCEPVELIPEMQAMSDMQLTTEDIDAVVSDQNQNKCEEQLENPASRESEPDQNVITNPLVKIQESKSPEVNVIEEHLEFSSSEKKRKIGSTRKSLRVQNPVSDQKNKYKTIEEKENIMEQNTDQNSSIDGVIKEETKDSNEEIIAGQTENFTTEDITTVCSQQYTLCELSSQTTDLSLFTIEHPSPASEHHGVMEDNGNSVDNVDTRNAEIHTQTQSKKKKKFGSTRRPHGEHKTHAEEEKGELKDAEVTEEIKHQITTRDATSHMLTESQNPVSEVSLNINDSLVPTDQQEKIQSENEIMTERIDAPPALLDESKQFHIELSDEVSDAGELTDVTEQEEKTVVNVEKDTVSRILNKQVMAPVISPMQDNTIIENLFLAVNNHNDKSPDHEHASSTCGPVELIPEMQAMSDMQLTTENIDAVVSDENQNKCEEQLENPTSRESEPDQNVITSPFVQIQDSNSPQVDVIKENLEFSSSKKRRKIGSTRKSLRGQIPGSDQINKSEAINEQENIQEQDTDQNDRSTGVIKEESNDSKEEIHVSHTENFTNEDIIAVCSQQYTLCELSSQTTDLSLSTIEHPSPAPQHPEVIRDDEKNVENVENRNAEIHTQTPSKKKKKFGSTRRPHGGHEQHAEGEKNELKDAEVTEELEHQIITQDATSHILTESQNPVSEVSLDISDSLVTTEQQEIIKSVNEIMKERIDAPPALSDESEQIHTELSDEVSNTGEQANIIEHEEKPVVNEEKETESIVLNEQGLEPVISPMQDNTFIENVFLAVKKHGDESPDHEHASSTCGPVELISEMEAMSDMQMTKENITAVISDENQNKCEEQLENPASRESEPDQHVITSPFVQIHDSNSPQVDVIKENLEFSSSKKKRKIGSTRRSLRGQIPGSDQKIKSEAINEQENIQEQDTDQNDSSTCVIEEESNDSKKEIHVSHTENITKEDITTIFSQQYTLCELSSQTTDLSLSTNEHPSPAPQHPEVIEDNEMAPVISPIKNDAFMENVFLAVNKHNEESPDHEHASSTCEPVELIPEMQAMSDMQLTTEDIDAVLSDQNQNKCEEQLENPTSRESEPDQNVITSPLLKIQESKSPEVDVIEKHLEFRSSEKKRKIGSTRKSLRVQNPGSDQKNKYKTIEEKENIMEQNTDQYSSIDGVIKEEIKDSNEEIIAGQTENFTTEDITTVCSQQYTLCELSSQTTDLSLFTIEHPSPAPEHHEVMKDNGNSVDNVDTRNAEIHTQTQIKKKRNLVQQGDPMEDTNNMLKER